MKPIKNNNNNKNVHTFIDDNNNSIIKNGYTNYNYKENSRAVSNIELTNIADQGHTEGINREEKAKFKIHEDPKKEITSRENILAKSRMDENPQKDGTPKEDMTALIGRDKDSEFHLWVALVLLMWSLCGVAAYSKVLKILWDSNDFE